MMNRLSFAMVVVLFQTLLVGCAARQPQGWNANAQYHSAVVDYKAGEYQSAWSKFEALDAQNYHPVLFQDAPIVWMRRIAPLLPPPQTVAPASPPARPVVAPPVPPIRPPVIESAPGDRP